MKFSLFVAIAALIGLTTVEAGKLRQTLAKGNSDDIDSHFANFIAKHQRNYKSSSEYQKRLGHFAKNKAIVDAENAKGQGYELELNKFADLSDAEYKSMLGTVVPNEVEVNLVQTDAEEEEVLAE